MPTRLVFLSDTHLPRRAKDLPPALWAAIEDADLVVHAGDWVDLATVDRIAARARRLVAVRGNNDVEPGFADRLPLVAYEHVEGLRFAVVHETGAAAGRDARMAQRFPDVDVLVFGHSHIPWDSTASSGLRLLNPGSPTDRRRQPDHTWMTAVVDGRDLAVELVRLPPVPRER
ncbi:YfcE family phosphodiesterase [Curtobacterium sp. MCBD17_034]|uniref:metallophosphoesterase family protein n=1 Tax=unclassified Curtobacterium TaxID=257496 RepID=UPI000DA78174|nr:MULTISPECIES: metallophosphoesterase family protein [unclassified Curtobacterium]PZF61069.1 YfcE family phosphodiesterase [Curtobacterium sp. MCBD17_034]PZM40419.1 YfcE family phosphodiesterase [Curtobacterium sp. MCBD17_031]